MTFFFQMAVDGLSLGMMYALISIGFVIIFKCSKAFNIAQGYFCMLGGYLGYTFLVSAGLPVWAAILCVIAAAVVLGLLIERLALRPLLGQPVLAVIMMTIALAVVIEGITLMAWGGEYKTYHGMLPENLAVKLGDVSISSASLMGLIVSVIVVALLVIVFRFTKIGLAMRATAEDEQVTRSLGVKATTVYALAWVIACVTGVVAGILMGGVSGVMTSTSEIGLKALAVVILGGLDSVGGVIAAGLILGVTEKIAMGYLDHLMPSGGGLANVFPFLVMIVVLIIKPHGLFGLKRIERV